MKFKDIEELTRIINSALGDFCSTFQYKRKELFGLGKVASKSKLFEFIKADRTWVINSGGGTEVQYHLFFEDDSIEYGLGFNTQYVPFANEKTPVDYIKPYADSFLSQPQLLQTLQDQGFEFLRGNETELRQLKDNNYVLIGKGINVEKIGRNFEMLEQDFKQMISDLKGILFDTYVAVGIRVNRNRVNAPTRRYSMEEFEQLFKVFLQRTIPNSASNYLSAVPTINRIGKRHDIITESLYELQEPNIYNGFYDVIKDDDEYIQKNDTGHNMYHSSLKKYREFLEELNPTPSKTSNFMENKSLNQILYGPPGTGKTYNSINKAIQILGVDPRKLNRNDVKKQFSDFQNRKRLFFTTFHQNMAYEDFIEGIKPVEPEDDDTHLKYRVQEGLFMKACIEATYNYIIKNFPDDNQGNQLLTYNQLYDRLFDEVEQAGTRRLVTKKGSHVIVSVTDQGNFSVQHEGDNRTRTYTVSRDRLAPLFETFPNPEEINNIQQEIRSIIGGCNYTAYWSVLNEINRLRRQNTNPAPSNVNELPYEDKRKVVQSFWKNTNYIEPLEDKSEPFVFIIDEISRGNVAQIFGELITLMEEDKRLGKPEMIKLDLPYSKAKFCVPPNLYLIGTMNTADRSVEALDTALRRRFSFEEMPPRAELVSPQRKIWDMWWKYPELEPNEEPFKSEEEALLTLLGVKEVGNILDPIWIKMEREGRKSENQISYLNELTFEGINLSELLNTINKRIEKLLDKDHLIGHSFFMSVYSLNQLQSAFYDKVIPLLQEYFFGDFGKIGLILGKGFINLKTWDEKLDSFAEFDHESATDFSQREVFEIINYRDEALDYRVDSIKMNFEKAILLLMKKAIA